MAAHETLFARRVQEQAHVAPIVRQVHCEQCGCNYTYEMIRRGTGATSTAYGLFSTSRQKAAAAQAAQSLQVQLDRDHDPVGCPDCGWIQSAMVADLRRRSYRWMTKPAWSISILLLLLDSLVIVDFISAGLKGAPVRPIAVVVAAVAMAAVVIVLAAVGLQYALRSRINPNRLYPWEPGFISGAPSAVKLNSSSHQATLPLTGNAGPNPTYARKPRELERGNWITVQLARFRCPSVCCKCLSATEQTYTLRITKLAKTTVPFCSNCRRRTRTLPLSRPRQVLATKTGTKIGTGAV
jgi:hypothetical protein